MLQYVWFNLPELWDWKSISVRPLSSMKSRGRTGHPKADRLKPLIDLWQAYLTGVGIPDIATLENPSSPQPGGGVVAARREAADWR